MKLKITSCEKIKDKYKVEIEYLKEDDLKFYPDGKGGQLGDRGKINDISVLEVFDSYILVEKEITLGEHEYEIDMRRREMISIEHTGEHLFSGIAEKHFDLKNVGFRMGEEYTTVDLDSNTIMEETVNDLMIKISDAIAEGVEVIEKEFSIEEAKTLPLRKPLSDKIKSGLVKVVEIKGYDYCACAGFHTKNTKDIRLIKLLSYEKIKNNCMRFYFVCGERAISDYNFKHEIITKLNHKFSCRDYEIITMIEKQEAELEKIKREANLVSQKYISLLLDSLFEEIIEINSQKFIIFEDSKEVVEEVRKEFLERSETFIGISEESIVLSSNSLNCNELIKKIISFNPNLKGGGKPNQGNIKGSIPRAKVIEYLRILN